MDRFDMRSRRNIFQNAAEDYAELKKKFGEFCVVCAECFTDNQYYPGVTLKADGDTPILFAFDRRFEITVDLAPERYGLMCVWLSGRDEHELPVRLAHWFFQEHGMVKRKIEEDWGYNLMTEKDFAVALVNELAERYMQHIGKAVADFD